MILTRRGRGECGPGNAKPRRWKLSTSDIRSMRGLTETPSCAGARRGKIMPAPRSATSKISRQTQEENSLDPPKKDTGFLYPAEIER